MSTPERMAHYGDATEPPARRIPKAVGHQSRPWEERSVLTVLAVAAAAFLLFTSPPLGLLLVTCAILIMLARVAFGRSHSRRARWLAGGVLTVLVLGFACFLAFIALMMMAWSQASF